MTKMNHYFFAENDRLVAKIILRCMNVRPFQGRPRKINSACYKCSTPSGSPSNLQELVEMYVQDYSRT